MARAPRQQTDDGRQDYFVIDPHATSVGGIELERDKKGSVTQTSVRLTPAEAALAIANGSISPEDPSKSRHARRAVAANLGETEEDGKKK